MGPQGSTDLHFCSAQPDISLHREDANTGLVYRMPYWLADTHCTYPWRDGQAELTWVDGLDVNQAQKLILVLTQLGIHKSFNLLLV